MSCNGCRVLRKGCGEKCILRSCLQWIENPDAQGHATVFVAKFFGRAGLMKFISSVPESQRPAIFQSLLFEACGRTVNPVNGALGLLWSGKWSICQSAVETILRGGTLQPLTDLPDETSGVAEIYSRERVNQNRMSTVEDAVEKASMLDASDLDLCLSPSPTPTYMRRHRGVDLSLEEEEGSVTTSSGSGEIVQPMLLNLFI